MDSSLRIAIKIANKQALTALKAVETQIRAVQARAIKTTASLKNAFKVNAATSTVAGTTAAQQQVSSFQQQQAGEDARRRVERAKNIAATVAAEKAANEKILADAAATEAKRINMMRDRATKVRAQLAKIAAAEASAAEKALAAAATAEAKRVALIGKRANAVRTQLAATAAAETAANEKALQDRARTIIEERAIENQAHQAYMADVAETIAASERASAQRTADSAQTRTALTRDMMALRATHERVSNQIERSPLLGNGTNSTTFRRTSTAALTAVANVARSVTVPALASVGKAFTGSAAAIQRGAAAVTASIGKFGASLRGLNARMIEVGRQSQWLGRQIEFRIGLPILAVAAASIKFAKDSNAAWTSVVKVYNGADRELVHLRKSVRLISDELGIHQEEVIGVMQVWAQAGRVGIDLAEITDLTMRTAILGNLGYAESAQSLIVVQDAFQLSTEELQTTLAMLNLVENQTKANTEDLIEVFKKAGAQANVAGVSIAELAGMTAALIKGFGTAGEIGTSLNTIMRQWADITPEVADGFAAIGIDVTEAAWRTATFTEQLQRVATATQGLETDALREVTAILGKRHSNKLIGLINDLNSEHGRFAFTVDLLTKNYGELTAAEFALLAADEELQKALNSDSAIFDRQINRLRNMGIEIGSLLLPVLNQLVGLVLRVATAFRELDPATQKLIGFGLLAVAAIGPLMGVLGSLSILVGSVSTAVLFLASAFSTLVFGPLRIIGTLFGSVMAAASSLGSAIAGTLTGAFMAMSNAAGIAAKTFASLGSRLGVSLASNLGKLGTLFKGIAAIIPGAMIAVKATLGIALAGAFSFAIGAAVNTIRNHWDKIRSVLVNNIKKLPASVQPALMALLRLVESVGGLIGDVLLIIPRTISLVFTGGVEAAAVSLGQLPGIVSRAFVAVVNVVKNAALAVYSWFSWINPFARHSPSLVENVQNGTHIIAQSFKEMANSVKVLGTVKPTLYGFLDFVNDMDGALADLEDRENRFLMAEIDPNLIAGYDAALEQIQGFTDKQTAMASEIAAVEGQLSSLETHLAGLDLSIDARDSILTTLGEQADDLTGQIDDARRAIEDLANINITGENAANEELFNLDMERKQVELEMAKINRLFLNSEMPETAEAQLEELQKILDGIDLDIEIAELGRDIEFDPLRKEIEELVNPLTEMNFDDIIAGIEAEQDSIITFEAEHASVLQAIEDNEAAVAELRAEHALVTDEIEKQEGVLQNLETAYDNIGSKIDDANSSLEAFISNLRSSVEAVPTDAASSASDATESGLLSDFTAGEFTAPEFTAPGAPDSETAWEQYLDQYEQGMQQAFSKSSIRESITNWWENTWSEISPDIDWDAVDAALAAGFNAPTIAQMLNLTETEKLMLSDYIETGEVPELDGLAGKFQQLKDWWDVNGPLITKRINELSETIEEWRDKAIAAPEDIKAKLDEFTNSPTIQNLISAWEQLTEAAGGTQNVFILLGGALLVLTAYLAWPVAAIGIVVGALILLETHTGLVSKALEFIAPALGAVTRVLVGFMKITSGLLSGDTERIVEGFKDIWGGIVTWMRAIGEQGKTLLTAQWEWMWNNRERIWGGITTTLAWAWDLAWNFMKKAIELNVGLLDGVGDKIWNNRSLVWGAITDALGWAWGVAKRFITSTLLPQSLTSMLGIGTAIDSNKASIWGKLGSILSWAWGVAKDYITATLLPQALTALLGIGTAIWNNRSAMFGKLGGALIDAVSGSGGLITNIPIQLAKIMLELLKLGPKIITEGPQMFGGLATGMSNAIFGTNGLISKIPGWVESIISSLAGALSGLAGAFADAVSGGVQAGVDGIDPTKAVGGQIPKTPTGSRNVGEPVTVIPVSSTPYVPPTKVGDSNRFARGGVLPTQFGMTRAHTFGGGGVTDSVRAIIGEGSGRHNEYAITTDPRYKNRSLGLLADLSHELGVSQPQQRMSMSSMSAGTPAVQRQYMPQGPSNRTMNFYGDLSFPNITDADDAEEFIDNLEAIS